MVDASTARLVKKNPGDYTDPGYAYEAQLWRKAPRHGQGDPRGLNPINTCFNVAMHGHQPEIYTAAFQEFFGESPPVQKPGFQPI